MTSKIFYISLFFLVPFYLFSQSNEKAEYVVQFKSLLLDEIDEKYLHLAESIPRLLYYEFKDYPVHRYSLEELTALSQRNYDDYIQNHFLNLSLYIEKRDSLIFNNNYNKEDYLNIIDQIEEERDLLSAVKAADVEEMEKDVPLRFFTESEGSEDAGALKSRKSDMDINGSIEKLGEWLYLKIWIENQITKEKSVVYDSIGNPDTILDLIPEIINRLKEIVLGRTWAGMILEMDPTDSGFVLKRQETGEVEQNLNLLYPGLYELDVSRPGYKGDYFLISLDEQEIKTIQVKLELIKSPPVSLQSFPAKADVYSGASWIGRTPLFIRNPMFPSLLTLKLEGYNDYKYILTDSPVRDIKIFMQSDIIDQKSIIDNKRDIFYNSFSYFLLSIPVSMISYGLSSDYGYAFNREVELYPGSIESQRLMQLSTSWYNVYIGGVFINVTLFINTLFDLVEYIKSNEKF